MPPPPRQILMLVGYAGAQADCHFQRHADIYAICQLFIRDVFFRYEMIIVISAFA